MYRWLGADANAARWCQYLDTDGLQRQLLLGSAADPAVLADLHQRFASPTAGLDRPRFGAVRQTLKTWHEQLVASAGVDLPGAARAAKERFRAVEPARLAEARVALREAATRLDALLAGRGAALRQSWRAYLKWDQLTAQVSEDAPTDQQALAEVAEQFSSGVAGLEIAEFARVRRALRRYRETVALANDPHASQTYGQQLDRLAQLLETYGQQPTAASAGELAQLVQWLDDTGQAPELVTLVRHRYSHPNLILQVSRQTVSAAVHRNVHEPTPVEDVILGTVIRGQGTTQAEVTAQLLRSTENAAMLVRMDGVTHSQTIGYNGPVRIWSAGTTGLAGRMRLLVDTEGISSLPATACCWTSTRFCGLAVDKHLGRALIEKVAWKRAYRDKAQAEWIASRHAEARLAARMEQEFQQTAQDANQRLAQKVRNPLRRADLYPEMIQISSTDSNIWLSAGQVGRWQLRKRAL